MEVIWQPSPNFSPSRGGQKIIAIVNHITAGAFPGCLSWLCSPAAQAGAHYLVTRTGSVYQMVREADTAWHAGIVKNPTWKLYSGVNPNRVTIGIEHECISGGELTEAQFQATLRLQRELCAKYAIPADRDHIIGHCEINPVDRPDCPGKDFPWARLMHDLTRADALHDALEEGGDALEKRYNTIEEIPAYARAFIRALVEEGALAGTGSGLNITEDMIRTWMVWEKHAEKTGKESMMPALAEG